MSSKHKNPTISFRITDAERKEIEARILASGMMKKEFTTNNVTPDTSLISATESRGQSAQSRGNGQGI